MRPEACASLWFPPASPWAADATWGGGRGGAGGGAAGACAWEATAAKAIRRVWVQLLVPASERAWLLWAAGGAAFSKVTVGIAATGVAVPAAA